MTFLRVSNLSCRLGSRQVLRGVDFSLSKGSRLALVGRNGAGKTSILRCLLGRLSYQGSIEIDGSDLHSLSACARAQRLAYVPQQLDVVYAFSVDEFLQLGQFALTTSYSKDERAKMRTEAIELTGASRFLRRQITELSMGERQRVLLAAALAQGATLLLLDEPTAFLDPHGVEQFFCVLASLPQEKQLILATHELNFATQLCTEVLGLDQGSVGFRGSCRDFMQATVLDAIFGIKPEFLEVSKGAVPILLPRTRMNERRKEKNE